MKIMNDMNNIMFADHDPLFGSEIKKVFTHGTLKLAECQEYEIGADNHMMTDREKFYSVINQFHYLKPLWDQENHEIRLEAFEDRLGTLSTGEGYLARFMANIWFHKDRYNFSLIDAMGILHGKYKAPIEDWVKNPYWP